MVNGDKKYSGLEPRNNVVVIIIAAIFVSFLFFRVFSQKVMVEQLAYSQFFIDLEAGNIEKVTIFDMREIHGIRYNSQGQSKEFVTIIPYFDDQLMISLNESGALVTGDSQGVSFVSMLLQFLPFLLLVGFFIFVYRRMQGGGNHLMGFGQSKAKRYEIGEEKIIFKDVAGLKEAKYELQEVVEFLKNPGRFTEIGAKIPKGILLVGAPGTGKTMLARAVAGEGGVPFFHMSASDFVEMFVGVGASRVRDLFEQGRKQAPCIIFIDEIDAVGRTRADGYGGGHDEREQTLNQLLVEMDGFETEQSVIIIAATNRPDVLDKALLRPGRFDRQVVVGMPDIKEREAILAIHAKKITLDKNVDLAIIARATVGSSGADIANIVNEAALFAGRVGRKKVTMDDFEEARDKVLMGTARRSLVMSEEEKKITAYHEAGHALLHYKVDKADPIHKVSIIPRGRALGVTFSLPENDVYSSGLGKLEANLVILYGGYAAENLVLDESSTGAQNDISRATTLARQMVCEWGMSSLGPIALGGDDGRPFYEKGFSSSVEYSDATADRIDSEIRKILQQALSSAQNIMQENREQLECLALALLREETLDDRRIRELLGMDKKG